MICFSLQAPILSKGATLVTFCAIDLYHSRRLAVSMRLIAKIIFFIVFPLRISFRESGLPVDDQPDAGSCFLYLPQDYRRPSTPELS